MQRSKIAAVAVLAVAVAVVIDPLRPSSQNGAGDPTPAPSPLALLSLPDGTPLDTGAAYFIEYNSALGLPRIEFTVPGAGWIGYGDGNFGKQDHNPLMTPWAVRNLTVDPCRAIGAGELDPPVGPTIDDLAAGLVAQAQGNASTPTDVTVGGYPAKRLELSLPDGLDPATCEGGEFSRWAESNSTGGHLWVTGQRNIVYVIDVDGARTLIDTVYQPGTTEAALAEAEAVVASMRFGVIPPTPSPSSSPAT